MTNKNVIAINYHTFTCFDTIVSSTGSCSCIWNTCLTWRGTDYELSEDDTIVSKHLGVWYLIVIVFLLVIAQNNKNAVYMYLKKTLVLFSSVARKIHDIKSETVVKFPGVLSGLKYTQFSWKTDNCSKSWKNTHRHTHTLDWWFHNPTFTVN